MELRLEPVAIPEKFIFNYEELKQELEEKVKIYETLIYSDEQIKIAKADRADLNRLKKALNDERIRREKEYMQPFNAFKVQINEIIGIIDKPVSLIDKQIKEHEEQKRQEKKKKIEEYFLSSNPLEFVSLTAIWDNRWLNTSVSMKTIQEDINAKLSAIDSDLVTLSNLSEFSFEAIETYKTTLDLNKSIAEGHRLSEMQKRKAEQERIKAERIKADQEKVRAEQERLRKEQEEERARLAVMVTPEEVAESVEAYREAANVGGVHMSEELSMQYQAREEAVQPPKELPTYVCFKALLTVSQALELKEFFESRNIEFSRI